MVIIHVWFNFDMDITMDIYILFIFSTNSILWGRCNWCTVETKQTCINNEQKHIYMHNLFFVNFDAIPAAPG